VTTPLLWLIGPSGVGKSSVGWAIFTQLHRSGIKTGYVDLDQLGLCYPQLSSRDGEGH
jgi:adenylylsulfate kinase-like enzyme